MEKLKSIGAALLLILFAGAWIYVGLRLITYAPSGTAPRLGLPDAQVTIAGLLAAAVGAGTASVLGIEVAHQSSTQPVAQQAARAVSNNPVLAVGVVVYALVGCFVLGIYWFASGKSPDFVAAFALGFLGWLAATFAAVYRGAAAPGTGGAADRAVVPDPPLRLAGSHGDGAPALPAVNGQQSVPVVAGEGAGGHGPVERN